MRKAAIGGAAIAALAVCAVAAWLVLATSEVRVPVAHATRHDFEGVLITNSATGSIERVQLVPIADIPSKVATAPKSTLLVPEDAKVIESLLLAAGRQSTSRLVGVSIKGNGQHPQRVELRFTYTNRSYTYTYETNGQDITPVSFSHRDLGGSETFIYEQRPS